MFPAPEGEKLFLWTKATHAIQMASLFMLPEEMEILDQSRRMFNEKVDELVDQKIATGWKPLGDEAGCRTIENEASLWVEQNLPGYVEAFNKLDSLFGSAVGEEVHG
jgi:hypothetical protein